MKYFSLFMILSIILTSGCISSEKSSITSVEAREFSKIISDKDVFVLDVHMPEQNHIKGTNEFIDYRKLEENRDKLPSNKNTPIAVYCRSGSMSDEASKTLQNMGYTKIYNLLGGTNAWKSEGLEFDNQLSGIYGFSGKKAIVYKSSSCGCCVGYTAELKNQEFQTEIINLEDMSFVKNKYNITRNMESCHTAIIGDYFVEGHVPLEAVEKLLKEMPDIDGIALPGMPAGSPGMPGFKSGAFKIYALSNGKVSEFMDI